MPNSPDFGTKLVERIRAHLRSIGKVSLVAINAETLAKLANEEYAKREESRAKTRAKRAAFTPPSPEEVASYAAEIGFPMDGQAWCDHYDAKGWKVSGSTKMADWKAAVRKWKANGWSPSAGTGPKEAATQNASLGALQIELTKVERRLDDILYPGGCATKRIPTGEKLVEFDGLMARRESLKKRIAEF